MVKTIIIFVIAALFFVVAGVFRQSLKKEQLAEKEYTEGVVTRKIYSGSGNARFYVLMDYGGMKEEFQTVSYSGGTEHINPGDHVRLFYYQTEHDTVHVGLDGAAAIPCSASVPRTCNFFRLVGCIIAVLGIYSIFQV